MKKSKVKGVVTIENCLLDDLLARFDERGFGVVDMWPSEDDEIIAASKGHPGIPRWMHSTGESCYTTIVYEYGLDTDKFMDMFMELMTMNCMI